MSPRKFYLTKIDEEIIDNQEVLGSACHQKRSSIEQLQLIHRSFYEKKHYIWCGIAYFQFVMTVTLASLANLATANVNTFASNDFVQCFGKKCFYNKRPVWNCD